MESQYIKKRHIAYGGYTGIANNLMHTLTVCGLKTLSEHDFVFDEVG
jgi:hypothetical protein